MNKFLVLCLLCISPSVSAAAGDGLTPEQRANRVQIIDVFAAAADGTPGMQKVRFASYDKELAARLWVQYAKAFGGGDWSDADPALRHETIILSREGKTLVLSSRHRVTEQDPDLVVTAHGVVKLAGKTREEVLRAGPQGYLARREAFDRLIEECEGPKKKSAAAATGLPRAQAAARAAPTAAPQSAPTAAAPGAAGAVSYKLSADYPARIQAQEKLLSGQDRRRTLEKFGNLVRLTLLFLPFSIPWFVPLLMLRKAGRRAGLSSPLWLLPVLALSPLGIASALSVTYVTKGISIFSILAPSVCALLLRAFPQAPAAARNNLSDWGLTAALLLYCSVGAVGAVALHNATMARGSSERAALGQLSSLRSSVDVYYGDKEGDEYPAGLYELIPKYMQSIPRANTITRDTIIHETSDRVAYFTKRDQADDKGGWGYINQPTLPGGAPNPHYGDVFLNCTHLDLRGTTRLCDY